MESVNFSMLGDPSIAESLGKKGTSTDLTLYDKKESGIIRTWVAPNGFPEKIQPLMQAINLADAVVNWLRKTKNGNTMLNIYNVYWTNTLNHYSYANL